MIEALSVMHVLMSHAHRQWWVFHCVFAGTILILSSTLRILLLWGISYTWRFLFKWVIIIFSSKCIWSPADLNRNIQIIIIKKQLKGNRIHYNFSLLSSPLNFIFVLKVEYLLRQQTENSWCIWLSMSWSFFMFWKVCKDM